MKGGHGGTRLVVIGLACAAAVAGAGGEGQQGRRKGDLLVGAPAAAAAAPITTVPLKRLVTQQPAATMSGEGGKVAGSSSSSSPSGLLRGAKPVPLSTAALPHMVVKPRAYFAVLGFEGDQELLAMVDTGTPFLSVPLRQEEQHEVGPPPATTMTPPLSSSPPSSSVPAAADCYSRYSNGGVVQSSMVFNQDAAKAHKIMCSDERCVGTCVPQKGAGAASCGPLGGSCDDDGACAFSFGDPHDDGSLASGLLFESSVRVGEWSVPSATLGAVVPEASAAGGLASRVAVLGLSFGNYSLCPPATSCTRPLLDYLVEAQKYKKGGMVAEDRFGLCMDGEDGALVMGGGDAGSFAQGGKVEGTVGLVTPFRHYWVHVTGLRMGDVSIAPQLFVPQEGEDDEGCANATTTTSTAGGVVAVHGVSATKTERKKEEQPQGTASLHANTKFMSPSHFGVARRAMVDTGYSALGLPAVLFEALRSQGQQEGSTVAGALAGGDKTRVAALFEGDAVRLSDEEVSSLPVLEVLLEGGLSVVVPVSRWVQHMQTVVEDGDGTGGDYYALRVERSDHFILGLAALEGHYLEIDRSARTLSLAKAQPHCIPPAQAAAATTTSSTKEESQIHQP